MVKPREMPMSFALSTHKTLHEMTKPKVTEH